jgi:hypothetical protein
VEPRKEEEEEEEVQIYHLLFTAVMKLLILCHSSREWH